MPKPSRPGFKTALRAILESGRHAGNPAHLKQWLTVADDPIWEQIASEASEKGRNDPYTFFIASALGARQSADILKAPPSQIREEQRRGHRQAAELRALANKIDEVVRDHQRVQRYKHYQTGMRGRSADEPSALLASLELEARRLRAFADITLTEAYWLLNNSGIRAGRVGRAKKKGGRSRGVSVFIRMMVQIMRLACGKPHYNAVADMANIFFANEGANVDADDVIAACKPTTRAGRARKTLL